MKKSTKFGVGLALLISIFINYGCPGLFGYNIVGTWAAVASFLDGGTGNWTISFAGDKKTGTVNFTDGQNTLDGTYSVDGKNIDFDVSASDGIITFVGTFQKKDEMSGSGTLILYSENSTLFQKIVKRQAKAAAQSDSYAFDWTATRH